MYLKYFNPETDNPQKYFWFNSFKPDAEVRGKSNTIFKTTGEIVPNEEAIRLFRGIHDPILSKALNATVVYVKDDDNMKKIIDCLAIDPENCANSLIIGDARYIFSIQINYGMGVRQIMLNADHYIDVQSHYSIVYHAANKDRYINDDDFQEKFANPVMDKYTKYYMRKFEQLDEKTKRMATIR